MRGSLNQEAQERANELRGLEVTVPEIRLVPYLMSCLMDNHPLERQRINKTEENIARLLSMDGFLTCDPLSDSITFSEKGWEYFTFILKNAYEGQR